jgi:hypothetical protein
MKKSTLLCLSALMLSPTGALAADKPAATPIVIPAPKPGMGQVVFFRPGGMGAAIKCTVRENGKMVGRVHGNRYFVMDATPGVHTFTAKSESTDAVTVQVEPDETGFVKCKIAMGMMVGRPNLSPATEQDFTKVSAKLQPMDADKLAAEIAKDEGKLAPEGVKDSGGAAE